MKYTKEIINAMRTASYLIEPPASEVIGGLLDEIERLQAENRWHKYPDEKPETLKYKLISCEYSDRYAGNPVVSKAQYIAPKTVLSEDFLSDELDCDNAQEYDEEKDCYWVVEGWWECSEESEYNYKISGNVVEWRDIPLPPAPEGEG